jgi:hypothetical protein
MIPSERKKKNQEQLLELLSIPRDSPNLHLAIHSALTERLLPLFWNLHRNENLPFRLSVQSSSIPAAGNGVFLQGTVRSGAVVAIYQGTVYSSNDFSLMATISPLFTDNQFSLSFFFFYFPFFFLLLTSSDT